MDNSVLINREDFLTMLKPLKRFARRKQKEDAVLSMEGNDLFISLVGLSTGAPASGNWSGEIRVPLRMLWGIVMEPPADDPIRVEIRDGRLHIGTLSVSCEVQESRESKIDLPLGSEFLKMLRLRYAYPLERLHQAGLTGDLAIAQEKARKIIARAAKILAPLNITESDLAQFVQDRLRKGIEKN